MYVALDKTSDYQAALEVTQQVFCSFYEHMDRVKPEYEKAWLMRSAKNAAVDELRRRLKRGEIFLDACSSDIEDAFAEESLCCCEARIDKRAFTGRIFQEVKKTNQQWFEVLMLCCVEGLPYQEVSKLLQVSEPVLRARLHRARNFIRKKFLDEYLNQK